MTDRQKKKLSRTMKRYWARVKAGKVSRDGVKKKEFTKLEDVFGVAGKAKTPVKTNEDLMKTIREAKEERILKKSPVKKSKKKEARRKVERKSLEDILGKLPIAPAGLLGCIGMPELPSLNVEEKETEHVWEPWDKSTIRQTRRCEKCGFSQSDFAFQMGLPVPPCVEVERSRPVDVPKTSPLLDSLMIVALSLWVFYLSIVLTLFLLESFVK